MRADGEEFPVELAINRIAEADPPMFTGTIRDISVPPPRRSSETRARRADQLEAILQRRGGRRDRAGARRHAPVRQRRRGEDARLRVHRGAAERPARRDHGPLRRSSTRTGGRSRSRRCPAAARSWARTTPRRRALPRARDRRGALVGRQGHPDPRRGRQGDHGDQRDRGHHRAQARGAVPALPRAQRRGARLLAGPGRAARGGGEPGGARRSRTGARWTSPTEAGRHRAEGARPRGPRACASGRIELQRALPARPERRRPASTR